ncbi:MAG: cysteine desulfurase family protein [Acidimicrobiales bacterium]
MIDRVYFDNAATTPLDPAVAQAMHPWLDGRFGNASSLHAQGRLAREAVDQARQQVAALLNADPAELVFTGSGTEADNLALIGLAETFAPGDCHIVTSAIEHPAILSTCSYLARRGVEVTYLPVSGDGIVDPAALEGSLRRTTRLVSVMAANNVVGTVQPITDLARIAHEHGALFHTDAVQAVGKLPLDVRAQSIDLLSLSAHKLNGPQGVGALYLRKGVELEPLVHGGGQERGLRSGTESVAGLVGLGQASELARVTLAEENARLVLLGERILRDLASRLPHAYLIGDRYRRLPGHLCVGFQGQEGEAIRLLLTLDELGIAVSTGSACSAHHAGEPSSVLLAMGFDPVGARGSLRITLGRFSTDADIDRLLEVLPEAVESLRPITTHLVTT